MRGALIQQAPVERDESGWWTHPDMPGFDEGQEREYRQWIVMQGLEVKFFSLEDAPDNHPAYIAYYDKGEGSCADWAAQCPVGDGWFTLSIHDSEDGPYWVWARRIGVEEIIERAHTEAINYHARFYVKPLPGGQRYSGSTFKNNGEPILLRSDGSRSIFCDVDE